MIYQEIEGDLISLALEGKFDVIAHGCNCHCVMGAGIAVPMNKIFSAGGHYLEGRNHLGNINKLGMIGTMSSYIKDGKQRSYTSDKTNSVWEAEGWKKLIVVNCYTQFQFGGQPNPNGTYVPVDYEAIQLCMRKINYLFPRKQIGLPLIGCGLAGGDWNIVKGIIQEELRDMNVTIVHFKQKEDVPDH